MTTITIALSEERLGKLKELAARLGVVPEELVRISIDELLAQPEEAFGRVAAYVLRKCRPEEGSGVKRWRWTC